MKQTEKPDVSSPEDFLALVKKNDPQKLAEKVAKCIEEALLMKDSSKSKD